MYFKYHGFFAFSSNSYPELELLSCSDLNKKLIADLQKKKYDSLKKKYFSVQE